MTGVLYAVSPLLAGAAYHGWIRWQFHLSEIEQFVRDIRDYGLDTDYH